MKRLPLPLERYRTLVVSVAVFFVVFVGVLGLNVHMAAQIDDDALAINLAGRQRMLTQRMSKSLLELDESVRAGTDAAPAIDELRIASGLFESTLHAFEHGGVAVGGNGEPVSLRPVDGRRGLELLAAARASWMPTRERVAAVLGQSGPPDAAAVSAASAAALERDGGLLGTMNALTSELQRQAADRAGTLRAVQLAGMIVAIACFLFIVVRALGQLARADTAAEGARRETDEILRSVQEGLFLLDRDMRIGRQQSAALPALLGGDDLAGRDVFEVLRGRVPGETLKLAKDYVELLFGERVNEKLVRSLNPLHEVELARPNAHGGFDAVFLDLRFARVASGGRTEHLLVTAVDVTARVTLERELAALKLRLDDQFSLLSELMDREPSELRAIVGGMRSGITQINAVLRGGPGDEARDPLALRNKLDRVFALAHRMKGDASSGRLDGLEASLHELEAQLDALRKRNRLAGDDFLPAVVALEAIVRQIDQLGQIVDTIAAATASGASRRRAADKDVKPPDTADTAGPSLAHRLDALARRIADRQDKRVEVSVEGFAQLPPGLADLVSDVAIQLVRNAVSHGVRAPRGSTDSGHVHVALSRPDADTAVLSVEDDGGALADLAPVRERAVALGWTTREAAASLGDRELLTMLFRPGFSTAAGVSVDAGHGVGLDLVQRRVGAAGGRIGLQRTHRSTRFTVTLPVRVAAGALA